MECYNLQVYTRHHIFQECNVMICSLTLFITVFKNAEMYNVFWHCIFSYFQIISCLVMGSYLYLFVSLMVYVFHL